VTPSAELDALLAQEIDRRLGVVGASTPTLDALRTVLHVLKGSASMAGHHDLTLLVTQLSQRLRAGEEGVEAFSIRLLREVSQRLKDGRSPFDSTWPEPPEALKPSLVPPDLRGEYLMTMRDRLRDLQEVISGGFGDLEQLANGTRVIHSMKALAASVGDDTTAWYCHNLEAKLRKPRENPGIAMRLFGELASQRATLLRLLESPDEAFAMLRAHRTSFRNRRTTPPPFRSNEPSTGRNTGVPFANRSSTLPPSEEVEGDPDATLRIPTAALDQLFDHVERIDITSDKLFETTGEARNLARKLADLRHHLTETQRLLSSGDGASEPPRVFEQLASAITTLNGSLALVDRVEQDCRASAELLRTEWYETRRSLGRLRRTTLTKIFARCERAAYVFAESEGKRVDVEILGGEWSIDRTLGERLLEPLLQIAKNAISHGIESPEQRLMQGKPGTGKLRFVAERHGEWIRLIIEDDGAGVDLERVRCRAVEQGLFMEDEARILGENELLSLLFVPGLSTRSQASIMAGRGIGLDLSQDVVRRLGGGIRFSVREQGGVRITLELPQELGLMDVVWVLADSRRFAIPVTFTGAVYSTDQRSDVLPLLRCLGKGDSKRSRLAIDVVIPGLRPLTLGIDDLGECEEVTVRPLPTRLAKAGPYLGAVLSGDGRLDLVLDAPLVAARAWIHAA